MVDAAQPIINIVGERVSLGPFPRNYIQHLIRWRNDYTVMQNWLGVPRPETPEYIDQIFSAGLFGNPADVAFAIYERSTERLIGYVALIDIDSIHRTAEFGIMLGEADARGKGYGTEATRLMLDQAFTAMGLQNVLLRVFEYNRGGIRTYEKAGFRTIGVRRKSKFMGGRFWDTIFMEALAEEFESPVLATVLVEDPPR